VNDSENPWVKDRENPHRLGFAKQFLNQSVIEASLTWYGREVAEQLKTLLAPIYELDVAEDQTAWSKILDDIAFRVFEGKQSLMRDFEDRISNLHGALLAQ
jgi:hypothetical protein